MYIVFAGVKKDAGQLSPNSHYSQPFANPYLGIKACTIVVCDGCWIVAPNIRERLFVYANVGKGRELDGGAF